MIGLLGIFNVVFFKIVVSFELNFFYIVYVNIYFGKFFLINSIFKFIVFNLFEGDLFSYFSFLKDI